MAKKIHFIGQDLRAGGVGGGMGGMGIALSASKI
jgi:hypothetical protein